jgi:hypothetical protein
MVSRSSPGLQPPIWILVASYPSNDEAARRIPTEVAAYYREAYPGIASEREAGMAATAKTFVAICDTNVFPLRRQRAVALRRSPERTHPCSPRGTHPLR